MIAHRLSGSLDMSMNDTYLLASKARSKLQREASRHDHDLRILVSHANMLDNLMDSLAQRKYKQKQEQYQQYQQQQREQQEQEQKKQQQQVDPILNNSQNEEESSSSKKVVTFKLPKPDRDLVEYEIEQVEHNGDEEEESDDEFDYEYDEDNYYEGDNDDDEEESDDEDYSMFEDCQLVSSKIYQSGNKNQYKVLPTVDESPLDDYHYYYGQEPTTTSTSTPTTLTSSSSNALAPESITTTPSVAIAEVSDEENDNDNTGDNEEHFQQQDMATSQEHLEVPSLCYSESDSDEDDDSSLDSEEVVAAATTSTEAVQDVPVKPLAEPTLKRLLLPSPQQLDLLIH